MRTFIHQLQTVTDLIQRYEQQTYGTFNSRVLARSSIDAQLIMSAETRRPGFYVLSVNTIEFVLPDEYIYVEYLSGGSSGNVM